MVSAVSSRTIFAEIEAMADPIITLTTDFGEESPYVAAMKGVILGINPNARILDLSHQIPPQDLRYAAFFLASAIPHFPLETLHVIVVDPGVGTERAILYVEVDGHRLLVPDNGCWTELRGEKSQPSRVIRLEDSHYWRHPVSATFHGRDIFAPVAAHLSLGVDPLTLGPEVKEWVRFEERRPTLEPARLAGEVLFVDRFGNLITNIPGEALSLLAGPAQFQVGDKWIHRQVRTYGEAEPGIPVALISSNGMLEFAVRNGNAAQQLGAGVGAPVLVTPAEYQAGESESSAKESPGTASELEALASAIPPRTANRGPRGGVFIALVLIPLISYSILATIALVILLTRLAPWDPLELLPDREGDFKGAKRQKQAAMVYERVRPESSLPDKLKVALGQTIRIGDLEVTPQRVEFRRVVFRQPGFAPELALDDSLVLHLLFRNVSRDVAFSPTDPFFDRSWKGLSSGKRPYTFLDIGTYRVWGGPLPWRPGRRIAEEETIEGQQYRVLQPGERLSTFVCTDPQAHVGQILEKYHGELIWRVQVRRGLVQVEDREYPATAVIGVRFHDTDIAGLIPRNEPIRDAS
jgi:S-adenosylmethionine hydrolase